jgi:hypothetical protein
VASRRVGIHYALDAKVCCSVVGRPRKQLVTLALGLSQDSRRYASGSLK